MDKWEYRVVEEVRHNELNSYGEDGWELAAISHGSDIGMGRIISWVYIFKRKLT